MTAAEPSTHTAAPPLSGCNATSWMVLVQRRASERKSSACHQTNLHVHDVQHDSLVLLKCQQDEVSQKGLLSALAYYMSDARGMNTNNLTETPNYSGGGGGVLQGTFTTKTFVLQSHGNRNVIYQV